MRVTTNEFQVFGSDYFESQI